MVRPSFTQVISHHLVVLVSPSYGINKPHITLESHFFLFIPTMLFFGDTLVLRSFLCSSTYTRVAVMVSECSPQPWNETSPVCRAHLIFSLRFLLFFPFFGARNIPVRAVHIYKFVRNNTRNKLPLLLLCHAASTPFRYVRMGVCRCGHVIMLNSERY